MRFIVAVASLAGIASATVINAVADVAVDALVDVDAAAHLGVKLLDAKKAHSGYKCPHAMSYCPWTKACACPPGQKLDLETKTCVGDVLRGAWPEPDVSVYASVGVTLGKFCAFSPTKIVKYDPNHEYCQANLHNVAFLADIAIAAEIAHLVEIDVNANISAELKNVCAALTGLYIEDVLDAVVAFNTDLLGLAVVEADIKASLGVGIFNLVNSLTCRLGLGGCNYDCVAYCTKGCPNYVDVVGELGGRITGLVGFCILPKVILVVNSLKVVVSVVVDGLLCLVGGVIRTVLSTFNCHCK
ncbi:uncharacterized protein MAM_01889 [Metarhizium album ARSEF 1941]|uniref:Secreted protein n=1 Tax=Metarhizium album (strain ARSEF 1941) TaxID=1081103 RepID=A0A0B2X3S4_METAS|nr:uncharacterized protein MAM_01889 [Metarhizium album ARSEF 1941]KHN99965.1 hypothetical protein MAM_01889 [Metarhizium album ARSEF 1941]